MEWSCTLAIEPVDVTLFRDGRSFDVGQQGLVSELPWPRSFAGAIRTWLLEAKGVTPQEFRELSNSENPPEKLKEIANKHDAAWVLGVHLAGPLIARVIDDGISTYYPLPNNVLRPEEGALVPETALAFRAPSDDEPDWWKPPRQGMRPLVPPDKGKWLPFEEPLFLSTDGLGAYLQGSTLLFEYLVPAEKLFDYEVRVGTAIAPSTRTVDESMLYSQTFLRLKPGHCFRVDVSDVSAAELSEALKTSPWLRLGGEGRTARVRVLDYVPHPSAPANDNRFLTYLATPGCFGGGWGPPSRIACRAKCVGADVGSPLTFSGWDLAKGAPEKTRYGVRAGAVYFWEGDASELPDAECVSDADEDAQAGWGLCLRGAW